MKILVVDDSALARGVIRRTLAAHAPGTQIEIVEAQNGMEALAAARGGGVDIAFVDWNMPVLDGVSFVRTLRAEGATMPIIMISAISDENKVVEAVQAGITEYIEKPVTSQALWERVKEFIK
jgi:two-component system chemotaxis response regulator CheY